MRLTNRMRTSVVAASTLTLMLSGCGTDEEPATAGPRGSESAPSGNAPVIDPSTMATATKGLTVWCVGKDNSGAYAAVVDAYNDASTSAGYELKMLELPESADEQRNQMVQRARAKSPECDILGTDVVWTAEFAGQGWVYDMTPYVAQKEDAFVPSTFATTTYQGRNWAVPFGTNVGLLYYRTDRVDSAPTTWQSIYAAPADARGLAFQGAAYEGLTVNFLELAYAAGGAVLSQDGEKSVINSPENLAALELMSSGVRDGGALKAVPTFKEEDARRAFESGAATFERNWTYQYVLGQKAPEIKGKFAQQPLPTFEGAQAASVLGGVNMAISAYSKNPAAALRAVDFITSADSQTQAAVIGGQPPTSRASYDDPKLQAALPFWEELLAGVEQARARPASPVYTQISQAIYKNVNNAISGQATPAAALKAADEQINAALASF